MYEKSFAKGIKRIISENGYKQKAIAEKAGIEPDVFSRIINGKRRIFAEEVSGICNALGYSFETIIEIGKESA